MKNDKLLLILKDFGLSDNEAKVYLSSLSLGPSTIAEITEVAEINRTTGYSVVQSLERQGLMSIEVKGFKKLYAAQSPERLEILLETKRDKFKKSFPEFAALYNLKGGEGAVKYFEGIEGVKSAYLELLDDLKPHDYYYSISEVERWYDLDPDFFESIRKRRAKMMSLDIKVIVNNTPGSREYKKKEKIYKQQTRILPKYTLLNNSITFTPHKIIFHQILPPHNAIVIENQSVIQTQKELFDVIWNSLSNI